MLLSVVFSTLFIPNHVDNFVFVVVNSPETVVNHREKLPTFVKCWQLAEKANYNVVGVYDADNAKKKATEACEQMEPQVRAVFTNAEIDGHVVLAAEIPPVEYWRRPVFLRAMADLKVHMSVWAMQMNL